jgi:hypothetical protein
MTAGTKQTTTITTKASIQFPITRIVGRHIVSLGLYRPLVTDEIERGNAVVITGNSFAIDDAGARAWEARRDEAGREGTLQHVD